MNPDAICYTLCQVQDLLRIAASNPNSQATLVDAAKSMLANAAKMLDALAPAPAPDPNDDNDD